MAVRPQTPPIIRAIAMACAFVAACVLLLGAPVVARADSVFAINGRGWGHGIGMSQWGARGYAQQGWDYTRILGWYFQRTSLGTRAELTVKVDLDSAKAARSSWRIAAASSSATLTVSDYSNGARSFEVTRGVSAWVTFSGDRAVLRADRYDSAKKAHVAGSVVATFPGSVLASTGSAAGSKVRLVGKSGPFSQSNIAWRGRIRFTPAASKGHAVDYVPMEQYLRGVVPRESGSSFPAEALRAQAVAARSYAYGAAASGAILWCTTMSQVYNGADDGTDTHEAATTDDAVADTANKVVTYGSSVVQTFFFSSSGGRTANSKDVWFSGKSDTVSPVYYRSVVDADSASPNYRWKLSDISGTTLAGKIRSHYASLAHSSPARVTTVTLEVGASGYVRYVRVKWSKGADTVLTGPQVEHALGLKSSAFTIKLTNPPAPPAPPATTFEQTDARPLWTGPWVTTKTGSASGGSYRRCATKDAAYTATFKGTGVSWIGTKTDHAGIARVTLDGTRIATVDLYSATTKFKAMLWSKSGLSAAATHTLTVTVTGTQREASAGSWVYIDAIAVTGSMLTTPRPLVWKRYDQNASAVVYAGAWKTSTLAGMFGGTHAFSHTKGATATFVFSGTRVRWIGKRAVNYGKAWVSIDTSAAVLVDLYAAKSAGQVRLFESAVLATGTHTVKIRVAGTRNAKATYHYVDVDAFEALEPMK